MHYGISSLFTKTPCEAAVYMDGLVTVSCDLLTCELSVWLTQLFLRCPLITLSIPMTISSITHNTAKNVADVELWHLAVHGTGHLTVHGKGHQAHLRSDAPDTKTHTLAMCQGSNRASLFSSSYRGFSSVCLSVHPICLHLFYMSDGLYSYSSFCLPVYLFQLYVIPFIIISQTCHSIYLMFTI